MVDGIEVAGQCCVGALVICSSQTDAFGRPELTALNQMTGDLAFGVATLRDRR